MADRASEFINVFNEIHVALQNLCGDRKADFRHALRLAAEKNQTVRMERERLDFLRELRNVIVHESRGDREFVAEPVDRTIVELKRIRDRICRPPLALSISSRSPHIFNETDSISRALEYMHDRDFSQVVVSCGSKYRGLTTQGITRWIASCVPDGLVLTETAISEVLKCERPGGIGLVGRLATVDDAAAMFEQRPASSAERLSALLVTESGLETQTPIGVITPWDLLTAQ